jgi:hypothetical protein
MYIDLCIHTYIIPNTVTYNEIYKSSSVREGVLEYTYLTEAQWGCLTERLKSLD